MPDLDRFQLFVIVRRQVSDRELLRRYLAIEAAMEEMAAPASLDVEEARLVGLGASIDAQLCRANPRRRGEVASEILMTEGAPPAVADAVIAIRRSESDRLAPLAAALIATEAVVEEIYEIMEIERADLDDVRAPLVAMRINRRAVKRDDESAKRVLAALDGLGLSLDQVAELSLSGMRRVREDLRL